MIDRITAEQAARVIRLGAMFGVPPGADAVNELLSKVCTQPANKAAETKLRETATLPSRQ